MTNGNHVRGQSQQCTSHINRKKTDGRGVGIPVRQSIIE